MKAKGIATILLLVFVGVSLVALVTKEIRADRAAQPNAVAPPTEVAQAAAPAPSSSAPADAEGSDPAVATVAEASPASPVRETVVVYYFHGNMRCATCLKIEALAGAAVKEHFSSLLDDKSLEWRVVNADKPENEHFIKDYQLTTKSIVLSRLSDSKEVKWKYLDRVWDLIHDDGAFQDYIIKEVESFVANDKGAGA